MRLCWQFFYCSHPHPFSLLVRDTCPTADKHPDTLQFCLLSPVQVEVYKSFRPGDIVLAKVVSFPLLGHWVCSSCLRDTFPLTPV